MMCRNVRNVYKNSRSSGRNFIYFAEMFNNLYFLYTGETALIWKAILRIGKLKSNVEIGILQRNKKKIEKTPSLNINNDITSNTM